MQITNNPQKNIKQITNPNVPVQMRTVQNTQIAQPQAVPFQVQQPINTLPVNQPTTTATLPNNIATTPIQPQQQVPASSISEQPANVPTPVAYQAPNNTNVTFDNYQSQYKYDDIYPQITVPNTNLNTIEGQYQSEYAAAINDVANRILNMRFSYNPNEDDLLKQATKYVTQNTFESMNGAGILNSSLTAERVTQVVGELIPQYEKLAREEFDAAFSRMLNTANMLKAMDEREFTHWKDARDQKWKEEEQEYQRKQDELTNAWKRVDELGYVDNDAARILGVRVGTLSKDAREAKEAYERQIAEWNRQHEIQKKTEIELLKLKQSLEKDTYKYQASFGNTSDSTSYTTYDSIIKNRYANYDEYSRKYSVSDNDATWNYIRAENEAGRMSDSTARNLISKYGLTNPSERVRMISDNVIAVTDKNGHVATLTVMPNTSRDTILNWGKRYGIDLSSYI